ncbi:MAG TPA: DUF192 domain-containing protein [candidate division Zixibacteria bacterium]|jgi:hypothetical protein|nr:DUF192 domain-containing protein [candidate division Zixibacteria bacterium]
MLRKRGWTSPAGKPGPAAAAPALFLLLAAVTALPSCRLPGKAAGGTGAADSAGARPGRIRLAVDTASLWVEVSDRPETRQAGLMFRRSLPEDEGMLFVFEEPRELDFWMRNTHLHLDIAFIATNGVILNIEAMKPLDEGPRYRSKGPARYAIEANQGWFAKRGIKPGHRVKF